MEQVWRLARRNPTITTLVAAVIVLLAASAAGAWWAVFQLRAENARAGAAERDALEPLIQSRQDQARAALSGRRPGQRRDSLAAVAEAARAARELGTLDREAKALRDLAAAALSLPDARPLPGGPTADSAAVTLAVDARGELYVTGNHRGGLRIGRVADGRAVRTIPGPGSIAYDLSFSPDSRFVAAQYDGQTELRLWAMAGAPDRTLPINGGMDFSPDGRLAAVPHPSDGVMLYELDADGGAGLLRRVGTLPARPGRHVCAFDPGGERLVVTTQGDRNAFDIFDLRTRAIVQSAELPSAVRHVAWDATGRFLAANATDDGIQVWDSGRGRWHARLTGVTKWVAGLSFTAEGLLAAVDDQLHVWDPETGRLVLESGGQQMTLVKKPAGGPTYFRRVGDRLEAWEVTRSPVCRSWGSPEAQLTVYTTAWVAGGRLFAAGSRDGVELYDPATGRSAGRLSEDPVNMVVACPPDGSVLTLGPAEARHYRVSTAAPGRVTFEAPQSVKRLTNWGHVGGVEFSPDGSALAFSVPAKEGVLLADWPEGRTRLLSGPLPWASGVAVSRDGRWVAASSYMSRPAPHRLLVWDAATGEVAKRFTDDEMPHSAALEFSPDGRWLVAGTPFDYRFFEVGSWAPGPRLPGSSHPGNGPVAFGPNGLLAVARDHTSVGLRSADTLEEIVTLSTPGAGWIRDLDFSPDGRYLAVTCHNGIVHVWDLTRLRAELAAIGLDY